MGLSQKIFLIPILTLCLAQIAPAEASDSDDLENTPRWVSAAGEPKQVGPTKADLQKTRESVAQAEAWLKSLKPLSKKQIKAWAQEKADRTFYLLKLSAQELTQENKTVVLAAREELKLLTNLISVASNHDRGTLLFPVIGSLLTTSLAGATSVGFYLALKQHHEMATLYGALVPFLTISAYETLRMFFINSRKEARLANLISENYFDRIAQLYPKHAFFENHEIIEWLQTQVRRINALDTPAKPKLRSHCIEELVQKP